MTEKYNGAFLIIAIIVALSAAALSGNFWGGAKMAVALATGCAAVGALLFASYIGLVRLLKNHLRHLIESAILTMRNPGLGSTKTQKQAEAAVKEVKRDFERASELIRKKK